MPKLTNKIMVELKPTQPSMIEDGTYLTEITQIVRNVNNVMQCELEA